MEAVEDKIVKNSGLQQTEYRISKRFYLIFSFNRIKISKKQQKNTEITNIPIEMKDFTIMTYTGNKCNLFKCTKNL